MMFMRIRFALFNIANSIISVVAIEAERHTDFKPETASGYGKEIPCEEEMNNRLWTFT